MRDAVRFLKTGGNGDRDVEGDGEQQLCLRPFSFFLRRPLLGVDPSLSVVVLALAIY